MRQSKLLSKFAIYFLNSVLLSLFFGLVLAQFQFYDLTAEFRKQMENKFKNIPIYHWDAKVSDLPFELGDIKVSAQWHYHQFGLFKSEIQGFIRGQFGFVPVKVKFKKRQNNFFGKWRISQIRINEFSEFHNSGIAAPTVPYYRELATMYELLRKGIVENCHTSPLAVSKDPLPFLKHQVLRNAQRRIDFAYDIPMDGKIVRVISQLQWTKQKTWVPSVNAVNCDFKEVK